MKRRGAALCGLTPDLVRGRRAPVRQSRAAQAAKSGRNHNFVVEAAWASAARPPWQGNGNIKGPIVRPETNVSKIPTAPLNDARGRPRTIESNATDMDSCWPARRTPLHVWHAIDRRWNAMLRALRKLNSTGHAWPEGPPPLSRLRAVGRQINLHGYKSALSKAFFDFCFPGFFERALDADGGFYASHDAFFADDERRSSLRPRRYAGDVLSYAEMHSSDLPRGRYYSLVEPSGTDGGLLCSELSAYMRFASGDDFAWTDDGSAIYGILRPGTRCRNLFEEHLQGSHSNARAEWPATTDKVVFIRLPTQFVPLDVDHCLDLRDPASRSWLHKTMKAGFMDLTGTNDAPPGPTFEVMLPALLAQQRGGTILTQAIGFLLRRNGVAGLVYPSARHDISIIVENGAALDWRGWNFLDYREAPPVLAPPERGIYLIQDPAAVAQPLEMRESHTHRSDAWNAHLRKVARRIRIAQALRRIGFRFLKSPQVHVLADSLWYPGQRPKSEIQVGVGAFEGTLVCNYVRAELSTNELQLLGFDILNRAQQNL